MVPDEVVDTITRIGLQLLVAIAILSAGRILAGLSRRLIYRLTDRPRVARNLGPSMRSFLARASFVVVMVLTVVIALHAAGVPDRVLTWGLGLIVVVLAVALNRSLGNLAATVVIIIFQPFKLGDDIETLGVRGEVQDIQLFNTVLRQFDHTLACLPNAAIHEGGVVNHSRTGITWAAIDVTVSYGENLATVRQVIMDVLESDPRVLSTPAPDVMVLRLGTEGVVIQAQPTVEHADLWVVLSDLQQEISTRLESEGISLAVPPVVPIRIEGDTSN